MSPALFQGIQVLTPNGLAVVTGSDGRTRRIDVRLDHPFAGTRDHAFDSLVVAPMTNACLLRALNVTGVGVLANTVFADTRTIEAMYHGPCPQDETRIHITFRDDGWIYQMNRPFSEGVEGPFVLVRTAVDQWLPLPRVNEESVIVLEPGQTIEEWIRASREDLGGTTGFIEHSVVLELDDIDETRGRVVWHEFLCCATSIHARVQHPLGDFGPSLAHYLKPGRS